MDHAGKNDGAKTPEYTMRRLEDDHDDLHLLRGATFK